MDIVKDNQHKMSTILCPTAHVALPLTRRPAPCRCWPGVRVSAPELIQPELERWWMVDASKKLLGQSCQARPGCACTVRVPRSSHTYEHFQVTPRRTWPQLLGPGRTGSMYNVVSKCPSICPDVPRQENTRPM